MPSQSRDSNKDKQDGGEKKPRESPAKSPSTKSKTASQQQKSPSQSAKGKGSKNEPSPKQPSRESQRPSRARSRPETPESKQEKGNSPKSEARLSKADNNSAAHSHKSPSRETKKDDVLSGYEDKQSASIKSTGKRSTKLSEADELQGDTGSRVITESISHHTESFKEDSVFNYSDVDFRPYDFGKPVVDARAMLHSGPEPCSCYPRTSSRTVPSMMYDQVRCVHNGYVGCIHEGVCRFDDGWNINHERDVRPRTQIQEERSYFRGYPQPLLDQVSESPYSSRVSEELKGLHSETSGDSQFSVKEEVLSQNVVSRHGDSTSVHSKSVSQKELSKPGSGASKRASKDAAETSRHGSIDDQAIQQTSPGGSKTVTSSHMWNNKLPRTPEGRPTTKDINGLKLPEIGHSPASPKRSASQTSVNGASANSASRNNRKESKGSTTLNDRNLVTQFTPINEETVYSRHASDQTPTRSTPVQEIQKNRTFQGKYYDPVTDQVYSYEVTHEFGKHMNRWPYKRQECDS